METLKLKIPEDISDINLGQYQKYHKLTERENLDEYAFNKRVVHIFCDIPYQQVDRIGLDDFTDILLAISRAIEQDSAFTPRFFIGDVEFGFIPNLDKITSKEFFDLQSTGLEVENLHTLMAILFRPIKSKDKFGNYTIHSYNGTKDYEDIMKRMPMNVVNGALVFFSSLARELRKHIQKSTEREQARVNKLQTTLVNGDGTQHYTN